MGELHLVDLGRSAAALLELESRHPRLSGDDLARIAAMTDPHARRERQLSNIALRLVLSRLVGDARYDGRPFERSKNGKPFIAAAPLSFSLSHSSGWALIAAVPRSDVLLGADIQFVAPLAMPAERRLRMLAAGHRLATPTAGASSAIDETASAIQAWVRIEAVAKASGLGLAHVLARLGIIAATASGPEAEEASARFSELLSRLRVVDIDVATATGSACRAALAISDDLAMPVSLPAILPTDLAGLYHFAAGDHAQS